MRKENIIIDCFAGGGGASVGIEMALGRQAVLDGLASIAKVKAKSDAQKSMMGRTMFFVEHLPSVSTEETGRWSRKTKVDAYDIAGVKTWGIKCQCDRCTFTTIVVEDFGYYKYCPNCGARMEVEHE